MKHLLLSVLFILFFSGLIRAQQPISFSTSTTSGRLDIELLGHASIVMEWNNLVIYIDPYDVVADFSEMPKADLIFITHEHADHFDTGAINQIKTDSTKLFYTSACRALFAYSDQDSIMANGDSIFVDGISVKAVPAYNIVKPRHVKGVGNGYLLWLGEKQIYIAGDTEIIPEMSSIKNVAVAFVGFSKYNMTEEMFVNAIALIKPTYAIPTHYDDKDISSLLAATKSVVDVEVLITSFYVNTANNLFDSGVQYYPNPVKTELYIPQLKEYGKITVYAINGEVVNSKIDFYNDYMNVSKLPEGIYLFRGFDHQSPFSFRFVVK